MKNELRTQNIGVVVVCFTIMLLFMQVVAEHSVGATKKTVQKTVTLQDVTDNQEFDQTTLQVNRNLPRQPEPLRITETNRELQQVMQVTLEATGYTCGPESTGKYPSSPDYCKTASGYRLKPGDKVVAMGEKYPFGTSVVVPGYGVAIVRDRGGAVSDNHIDLYFEQHEDALNWGRRIITITVIR